MDLEQEKESYNKGVKIGIAIGALSVTLVCLIVVGILMFVRPAVTKASPQLKLGGEVTDKMNLLLNYMDNVFLYDYDEDVLKDKIYAAMLDALDEPYSRYYTAEEYSQLTQSTNGIFYGIGASVTTNAETGDVYVVEVYEESGAEEAGVMAGDIFKAVDGQSVVGMNSSELSELTHGENGSTVVITFQRGDELYDAAITRRPVDKTLVYSNMLDGNIGYIKITQFAAAAEKQFKKAYEKLEQDGMNGLIIDVRGNPGGRLDTVTNMLDYLLPEGLLVYTMNKNGESDRINSDADAKLNIPCAVIVNGKSASASEVFCGAMQDYKAARIIGTQTFGKGIVQSIISLGDGSAIKITDQDYYTPNGNNIHKVGITPDEVVEYDEELAAQGVDTQLDAAIQYIKSQFN